MFAQNNQTINPQTLAYLVAVQIALNKADEDIIKYMKSLRQMREPNATKWTENKNMCQQNISNIYTSICTFGTLEKVLNA
jgi:hypothetical protein